MLHRASIELYSIDWSACGAHSHIIHFLSLLAHTIFISISDLRHTSLFCYHSHAIDSSLTFKRAMKNSYNIQYLSIYALAMDERASRVCFCENKFFFLSHTVKLGPLFIQAQCFQFIRFQSMQMKVIIYAYRFYAQHLTIDAQANKLHKRNKKMLFIIQSFTFQRR